MPNPQKAPPPPAATDPAWLTLAALVAAGASTAVFLAAYRRLFAVTSKPLLAAARVAYILATTGRAVAVGQSGAGSTNGAGGASRVGKPGPAVTRARAAEARFTVVYVDTAARRIVDRQAGGETAGQALRDEVPIARQQQLARVNRERAARLIDHQAASVGVTRPPARFHPPQPDPQMDPTTRPPLGKPTTDSPEVADGQPVWLQWYAVIDDRTSPECGAANGHLFDAAGPAPVIGWPGAVHKFCRCGSGKPTTAAWTKPTVNEAVGKYLADRRPAQLIGA